MWMCKVAEVTDFNLESQKYLRERFKVFDATVPTKQSDEIAIKMQDKNKLKAGQER